MRLDRTPVGKAVQDFTGVLDNEGVWVGVANVVGGADFRGYLGCEGDVDANEGFPQQLSELMGFLGDNFPAGHPYRDVHAVPGPWQAKQNRVAVPETTPELWILGSSTYSAHLAARLGRPYAFALQFGNADVETAMRIYREEFKPSDVLDSPYSMVSVKTVIADDAETARREATTYAMAMLRMLSRAPFAVFSPEEVESYPATANEQSIIDMYTNRTIAGTAETVADRKSVV